MAESDDAVPADRLHEELLRVQRAAHRGARSTSRQPQRIADAVEVTIARWIDAHCRGKRVRDPEAWAFRVAANAGRCAGRTGPLGRHLIPLESALLEAAESRTDEAEVTASNRDTAREVQLLLSLAARSGLRGRQYEVLQKLVSPDMSIRRAARELAMSPWNVRRALRSALARLRRARSESPPPP